MINKIILSPPFSNIYPNIQNTTRIIGTFTKNKRPGLHRVLTTLRFKNNSIYNNVGLRNPGISSAKFNRTKIISVSLLEKSDWIYIKNTLIENRDICGIEFNISCPNADVQNISERIIKDAKEINKNVILKLPHNCNIDIIKKYKDFGADFFHISNTKKTEYGAMSGRKLKKNNLKLIEKIKELNSETKIIGGGGIYDINDLKEYQNAGADHFSLSTILLNPFRTYKIINYMSQYQQLSLDHSI